MAETDIKQEVRDRYGKAALRVKTGGSSCCGSESARAESCCDPITANLYDATQIGQIPVDGGDSCRS